ncbi:uncharacterized protein BKA78DRAFT_380206 [Phyllosticta capitalensis]|uniref:uncharacterized protein n=1 Tax=Phyllosticta capitalensis TaxID=121624 RepID=UPI003131ABA8
MIVIQDVSKEPPPGLKGDLFADQTFWIAQRVPNRPDLVKLVKYNGGTLEQVESRAKYRIVDRTRDGLPPGAISHRYILDSVDNCELEDVETHRCGPRAGSATEAGSSKNASSTHAPRHGRLPFSAQDDRDLYCHMRQYEKKGAHMKGNEIYKDHAKLFPRHSFHSYRDRYLKHLSQKRPAGLPVPTPSPEPRPDSDSARKSSGKLLATFAKKSQNSTSRLKKLSFGGTPRGTPPVIDRQCPDLPALVDQFTADDFHTLTGSREWIEKATAADYSNGWDRLEGDSTRPKRTAEQWKTFWENCVRPVCQEVGEEKTNLQIYDEVWDRWKKKFGSDAEARKWVDHFRREIAPKLREQPKAQSPEAEPSSPTQQREEPLVNGHSKDLDTAEHVTSPAKEPQDQNGNLGLDGNFSSPIRSSWGKHPRENDSDAENHDETPPSKRVRINDNTGEDKKIHDSIEFSPTKKLASSPLGMRKVIQVGSDRSSSTSSDELFVRNHNKGKAPVFGDLFDDEEEDEVQEHEGKGKAPVFPGLSEDEEEDEVQEHVGRGKAPVFQDLFEDEEEDELHEHEENEQDKAQEHEQDHDKARDREDQDDQVRDEIGTQENVEGEAQEHERDQNDQVHEENEVRENVEDEAQEHEWNEWARKILGGLDEQHFYEMLEFLRTAPSAPPEPVGTSPIDAAVMHAVHVFKNGDPDVEEWERFNDVFFGKIQELVPHGDEDEVQDYRDEDGEQQAPENVNTNGHLEHEPTLVRESSPPRDPTPQPLSPSQHNPSLDTTSNFTDSYVHIDDDAFDDPTDLNSGADTEAYIASCMNRPDAFEEYEVVIALRATCAYSTKFADRVLEWMRENSSARSKGKARRGRRSSIGPHERFLPVMPGVWTNEDDRALLGEADEEEMQRIERKHGSVRCEQRRLFLSAEVWDRDD